MNRGLAHQTSRALFALAMTALFAASCSEGRFPVCKTNDECIARLEGGDGPKVCYNLRCVECRYDTDCPTGKVCNSNLAICKDIDSRVEDPDNKPKPDSTSDAAGTSAPSTSSAPATSGTPAAKGAPGATGGGAKTWDECAASCKDQACISACEKRFKK